MNQRFTIDGSPELEQRLDALCREVLAGVCRVVPRPRLAGLLLGGSYGRGEGGVLRGTTEDHPYNDLEFYVFLSGAYELNRWTYAKPLRELARQLSVAAAIEIQFSIASASKLRRSPISMFTYDFVVGHRWVLGNDSLLRGCEHHRLAETIPLSEATRLLMNRCSGLLFARRRLDRPRPRTLDRDWAAPEPQQNRTEPPDAWLTGEVGATDRAPDSQAAVCDFIDRNIAKAKLALGDAVLTALGQYHFSVGKRHQRLEKLELPDEPAWFSPVQQLHLEGTEFKLHPFRYSGSIDALACEHNRVTEVARHVWLWLEQRRLGRTFSSATHYALDPASKCPETNAWKNRVATARCFGWATALASRARAPHERLLNTLPLLLWDRATLSGGTLRYIRRQLRTERNTFSELCSAYEQLWARIN